MTGADADVIVVGSGPAGVSAAWPLVEAGLRVLMLDASGPYDRSTAVGSAGRGEPSHWQTRFGRDLSAVEPARDRSPKFGTPLALATLAGFHERIGLATSGFFAAGSLGQGGLSAIWGALATPFTAAERAVLPFSADDLDASYARVGCRIGLGAAAPPDNPAARLVLERQTRQGMRHGLRLEPAANAVIEAPVDGRLACNRCGGCLYGCGRGSIYASALELPALGRHPNFGYRSGHLVRAVEPHRGAHRLRAETTMGVVTLEAPYVVLAAGTIATTGLALARLDLLDTPVRLLSNPTAATAFVVPRLIGTDLPGRALGLGQLFYRLGDAAGVLYGADTLPADLLTERLPVGRPFALRLARALSPALLLATCYRPGSSSRNTITLASRSGTVRLEIEGVQTDEARAALRKDLSRLKKGLRRLGALPLPGSTNILEPGADAHYAGTLPMGGRGAAALTTDGEVTRASGLYVADGAALPALPSTHPTLSIMANADRIGRALARRIHSAPELRWTA